ncbi:MAG: CapA family protein [Clostridia bacterium]|nr:CapA family protein [Clostridia bacterium]
MNRKRVILIILGILVIVGVFVAFYCFSDRLDKAAYAQSDDTPLVEEVPEEVLIRMVGDNLIHNSVYFAAKTENGYNFDMLFENVKEEIESADVAIINQETILVEDESRYSSYPTFGSPTEVGDAIAKAGFDVTAHATNHTNDKGTSGILDTLRFWKNHYPEMKVLGIHETPEESDIMYLEKNGIKMAFVNYTFGLNGLNLPKDKEYMVDVLGDDEELAKILKEAKENSDILIPILHIGTEYVYQPTKYHEKYVDFCIDNGADIVLCAHPHVLEPYGMVTTTNGNTGLVYYSLGNFMSNQKAVPRILGGMAEIRLVREKNGEVKIKEYDMIPVVTHYSGKYYSTYKLSDYTDELAKKHTLQKTESFSVQTLKDLYEEIMKRYRSDYSFL